MSLDVSRNDQATHGMADQGDPGVPAIVGVGAVVVHEERPADDFVDEGGQSLLGMVERHAPVVAEGEHRDGCAGCVGEAVAELLHEVPINEGEGTFGSHAGRLAELVALVRRVQSDAVVPAFQHR